MQDVEPILNATLNDVVRKTVDEKSNCLVENPDICMVDYDLSMRLLYFRKLLQIQFNFCAIVSYILLIFFETAQCFEPIDTFHKCAYVDVTVSLEASFLLDDLSSALRENLKSALAPNGYIDRLINSP